MSAIPTTYFILVKVFIKIVKHKMYKENFMEIEGVVRFSNNKQ